MKKVGEEEIKQEENEKEKIVKKLNESDVKSIIEDVLKNKEKYGLEARWLLGMDDNKNDSIEVLLGRVNFIEVERGFIEIVPMTRMVVLLKRVNYYTSNYTSYNDELYVFFYSVGWVKFS
ncbi:hypothetical protein [Deltalipothrixvirus pozzuoliense]|uniref:Uncharacterized protein ORF119 n=1 Tax=Acidianus filamentous virus 2 (isolate Italy/Pozzuoli) TaxID=654910 RepID=Y119_AFV2P|nr:hypothetical protein AFV2_gp01 [Acidianus filamentous virus 2]Q573G8.1 RecName: Full=Uncharacterized protein ORF119 [Acidianus filamentous virus 2 (isolate Pozzuoli)]CAH69388.1 hypothetical protein [Acidianus filamentous virus 2]